MKILEKLERSKNFWFLLSAIIGFFTLRFPSLFEPDWYGDEGVYQALGLAVRDGRLLYEGIWDNKPPLLYLIYAFLNADQFWVKFASILFGIFAIVIFFYLTRKIFKSVKTSIITTSIFSLFFGLPILEGNIANAENFMALPILLSAFLLVSLATKKETIDKKTQQRNLFLVFLSGFFLGIAFLFKIVAIFDFLAFLLFLFFLDQNILAHLRRKNYQAYEVKKLFSYILGFLSLPLLTALFFLLKGAFVPFINATFFSNIGYVGYGNKFFIGNNIIIPQGLLILKILLLLFSSYLIFAKRKVLGIAGTFALLWFSFSLFNAFFSQRPYTHYLLVFLPSLVILLGVALDNYKLRKIYLTVLLVSLILVAANFSFYLKIFPYYGNFLSFMTNNKSVSEYQRFFDRITPTDYQLASFVKFNTRENENIFTWGNNAQLYKLSNKLPPGRYTVAYHVTSAKNGLKETAIDLELKKPKYIIIMPYMKYFPFPLTGYSKIKIIDQALVYERVL